MVDSGNTWRSAISRRLCDQLGVRTGDLLPLLQAKLGTARKGAELTILGELPTSIELQVSGSPSTFPFRPIVVDRLAMDINLSGPWMKRHNWDQIHSKDALLIDGKLVRLHKRPPNGTRRPVAAYVDQAFTAAPDAMTLVTLRAAGSDVTPATAGDYYLRGEEGFMTKTDLHPGLNALVRVDGDGTARAAVINTTAQGIHVPKGVRYGALEIAGSELQERIASATRDEGRAKKMAQDAKDADQTAKKNQVPLGKEASLCTMKERRAWLEAQFSLSSSPFLKDPRDLKAAQDVLLEFWDSFSHDGSYGKTHLIKHRIITEDVPPIKCRYRPINPALEDDLRKQLDKWLAHGVIEPANSPWSSNLVAAKKKDCLLYTSPSPRDRG